MRRRHPNDWVLFAICRLLPPALPGLGAVIHDLFIEIEIPISDSAVGVKQVVVLDSMQAWVRGEAPHA